MRKPLNKRGLSNKQKGRLLKGGFKVLADLENNKQELRKLGEKLMFRND